MSPRILVVLAGLAEVPGGDPTTLEATPTLALDAIARRGAVRRVAGLPVDPDAATVTGGPGSDLAAQVRVATARLREGAPTVVVHVDRLAGTPEEHDAAARRRELSRIDRDLLAPLAGVAMDLGATLAICANRGGGDDPPARTPLPAVLWGAGIPASGPSRVTETATAESPVAPGPWTPS